MRTNITTLYFLLLFLSVSISVFRSRLLIIKIYVINVNIEVLKSHLWNFFEKVLTLLSLFDIAFAYIFRRQEKWVQNNKKK